MAFYLFLGGESIIFPYKKNNFSNRFFLLKVEG